MVTVKAGVEWTDGVPERVKRLVTEEQTLLECPMLGRDELWHWATTVNDHACESSAKRNPKFG
jgi:hypothetical protein